MKRSYWQTSLLFFSIWLLLVVGGRSKFFRDPGTFWHVAVGEKILQDGFFRTDPFTFSFNGQEWIPHQWLGEIIMAMIFLFGGFDLLLVMTATLLSAVFTILITRLLNIGLHWAPAAVVLAIGIACSSGHFHVRPHLGTMLGFAILLILLSDIDHGKRTSKALWWLIPLFWVWSNIHGGVLGGIATWFVVLFGWGFQTYFQKGPLAESREFVQAIIIAIASIGVCFLNPYGWKLPESWLIIYRMESLPKIIQEHRPLSLSEFGWQPIVGFGSLLLTLLFVPLRQWRVTYVIPIIWFLLTITRVRHAPLFAISLLVSFADFFRMSRFAEWLTKSKSDMYVIPTQAIDQSGVKVWMFPAIMIGVLALLIGSTSPVDKRISRWVQLDPTLWPMEALPDFRQQIDLAATQSNVFVEYHFGGFLILHEPRALVFVDDRCELFGDQFLLRYVLAEQQIRDGINQEPGKILDDWQATHRPFDFALVNTGRGFDLAFASQSTTWEVVHRDETATIYRRKRSVK